MPPDLKVIHLDLDPWELGKNYTDSVAIQGDPKATLPGISEAFRRHTSAQGHTEANRRRDETRAAHRQTVLQMGQQAAQEAVRVPLSPLSLVHAISQCIPPGAVVVEETLSSVAGIRHFFSCADSRALFGMKGGGIGWGLPAALGVRLALPRRPVIALVGDGSAMYTIQALWTAARESLAVVFVIFNNASYRILKQRVVALQGFSARDRTFVGMDLDRPPIDIVGLARGFGVPGERIVRAVDVPAALERGFASSGPYLIDALIDPAVP
jgi:benzoylformate decarboxylase